MTITIVCDILGEENNGTTIACMNLIRFLRAQGHTVRVVCADQDKAGNECFYVVPELNLYLLNPIVERNGVTLPRPDRSLLEDAIRDCDVVHTTFVLQLSHTAVKIAKAYNKPITSSFHCQAENVTAHFLCKDLDAINRGVYRACYQMVYQYSDIIHYPTQFIRDTFEAVVGPTNGRVISNGVNSMFTPGRLLFCVRIFFCLFFLPIFLYAVRLFRFLFRSGKFLVCFRLFTVRQLVERHTQILRIRDLFHTDHGAQLVFQRK